MFGRKKERKPVSNIRIASDLVIPFKNQKDFVESFTALQLFMEAHEEHRIRPVRYTSTGDSPFGAPRTGMVCIDCTKITLKPTEVYVNPALAEEDLLTDLGL